MKNKEKEIAEIIKKGLNPDRSEQFRVQVYLRLSKEEVEKLVKYFF